MFNKFIAIATVMMAPSLAPAQSSGSNGSTAQQFNGALVSDTTDTTYGDTTRSDTSMMNQSDTTMMDTTSTDTMMMDTTRSDTSMYQSDTATDTSTYRDTTEEQGAIYAPPRGELAARNMGLSSDQVKELQQAINDAGCHAGPVDGIAGPQTREGIACVREQKGIQGDDLNDVVSALGLSFTVPSNADTTMSPETADTSTSQPSYQTDTTTTPTMDTTQSTDSAMVTDTTSMDTTGVTDTSSMTDTSSVMDTTTVPDTTTRDTSSAYPPTTTYPTDTTTTTPPVDSTMDPMNPLHSTDTTLMRPDTSGVRGRK